MISLKNTVTALIALSVVFFCSTADAQCNFDLTIEVTQQSTCISSGMVKITLSGEEIDAEHVLISISNGSGIFESHENGYLFSSLSPGTYNVTARAECKGSLNEGTQYGSFTIMAEYDFINAAINPDRRRSSLNCFNTGEIAISVHDGSLPYTAKIISYPDKYPYKYEGETEFTIESEGDMLFSGLAPGDYVIEVFDNCSNSSKLEETVPVLSDDFPSNPYSDDVLHFQGCSSAYISENADVASPGNIYWNSMRSEYYEVAFAVGEPETWIEGFPNPMYLELPETYSKLHKDETKMKVYIRLKGTECMKEVGEIQFSDPPSTGIYYYSSAPLCSSYTLNFQLTNESVVCPPLKWEIIDDDSPDDTIFASGGSDGSLGTPAVENFLYDNHYIIKVSDANGLIAEEKDIFYASPQTGITKLPVTRGCNGYELPFRLDNEAVMCAPFSWEIIDDTGVAADGKSDIDVFDTQTAVNLQYGKDYTVMVTDANGKTAIPVSVHEDAPQAEVRLNDPQKSCGDYSISFYLDNPAFLCSPLSWEIIDVATGLAIGGETDIDVFDTRTATNLTYDNNYIVTVTGANGKSTSSVEFSPPAPETTIVVTPSSEACTSLGATLSLADENALCEPVTWTVTEKASGDFVSNSNSIAGLEYNTDYVVTVVDANGKEIEREYRENKDKNIHVLDTMPSLESNYTYDLQYTVKDACAPYRWEVWEDTPTGPVFVKDSIDIDGYTKVIDSLKYSQNYIIMIIDDAGDTVTFNYRREPPKRKISLIPGGGGDEPLQCEDYRITTFVEGINIPYKWVVYREDKSIYSSGDSNDEEYFISGLKYDSVYIIEMTDGITTLSDTIDMGDIKFPEPFFFDAHDGDFRCNDYLFQVDVKNIYCPPYTFTVRSSNGDIIRVEKKGGEEKDSEEKKPLQFKHDIRLRYDTVYDIIVTYSMSGNTHKDTIIKWSRKAIQPYILDKGYSGQQCYDYEFHFTIDSIYCKYGWEVFNTEKSEPLVSEGPKGTVESVNGNPYKYKHSMRLSYDSIYEIIIKDSRDSVYKIEAFQQSIPPDFSYKERIRHEHQCDYEARFNVAGMPCKYSWEAVNDITGNIIAAEYDITPVPSNHNSVRLQYDTSYTITVTDSWGRKIVDKIIEHSAIPVLSAVSNDEYKCGDYEFKFQASNIQCYPYSWEIRNSDNKYIDGRESENDTEPKAARLAYATEHTVTLTDRFGHVVTLTVSAMDKQNLPLPDFEEIKPKEKEDSKEIEPECDEYDYMFHVTQISCPPYKWVVKHSGGTIIGEGEDNILQSPPMKLKYDEEYTITVTDSDGKTTSKSQIRNHAYTHPGFTVTPSYLSNCIDDLYRGNIKISKNDGKNMHPGTRIQFIEGPQTPVHSDITLDIALPLVCPFSPDYEYIEDVPIEYGKYIFEITDTCGHTHIEEVTYERTVEAYLELEIDEETKQCEGITRVYPSGQVLINGIATSETWFILTETPDGAAKKYIKLDDEDDEDEDEDEEKKYFEMSKTGQYVFEITDKDGNCGVYRTVIDHVRKSNNLDGSSSYVCGTGDQEQGNIRVQAKDGKQPYTYTLFGNDGVTRVEGIESNQTGVFEHGSIGEKYVVGVVDGCGKSFKIDVPISSLNNMTLLNGITNLCKGDEIKINCLMLGATSYEWTDPLGNVIPQQHISIPDAVAENSGTYEVKIQPSGCNTEITQSIDITVHDIPAPEAQSIELCVADEDLHIEATSLGYGYSLQWYNEDNEPLSEAPILSLRESKDTVFYVTQTLNSFSCVSEPKKIEIKINPLPEKNAVATGWSCENGTPEITVTDVVAGYVYTVYDNAEMTGLPVHSFVGEDESMTMIMQDVTVTDNTDFYLRTATADGCTLPIDMTTFQVSVNKLAILPDELPVYIHDVPYAVQLESNAVQPVYTAANLTATGISLTPDGLISGTVPRSAGYEETPFTVTVTDEKGCDISHEYLLRSCGPPPVTLLEVPYCKGELAYPLHADPSEGLYAQWLDADLNRIDEAMPSTETEGEQTFYVVQINDALNCTSDTAEVKVTVLPLPELDFDAPDINVCHDRRPVILLQELNSDYTYNIYADAEMTEFLKPFTGASSGSVTLTDALENTTAYYIRVIDNRGCASEESKEVTANVIKLEIMPDELPVYKHSVPYSIQLESNAEQPVFSIATDSPVPETTLIPGITLTSEGLISGTVPESNNHATSEFTVMVTDKNECTATKDYILQNCGAAPETPDAKVQYCMGTLADPLHVEPSPDGLYLQWYDEERNALSGLGEEGPTPLTGVAGEQMFYAVYVNDALHCTSDTAEIKVTVLPLPELDFDAPDINVCHDSRPVILLQELNSDYTYNIYADAEMTEFLKPFTGASSGSVTLTDALENTTAYYIRVIDNRECASEASKEVTATVIQLEIMPDELPAYKHSAPYSIQLESNAEQPVFSIAADSPVPETTLIPGITLTSEGLISGTVPESENHATSEFTVTVTDINECIATKDYILQSCGAAPETPVAEVPYCKGALADPLHVEPSPDGLYLQWYDEERNALSGLGEEGPTPLTGVAGEQMFYAVYVNDALHCTSDTAEIKVTVLPLPELDFDAPDINVCHGGHPVIYLSNLHETYIYDIYADAEMTEFLASVPEKPSGSVTLNDALENTTAYYIRVIDNRECVSEEPKEVMANVIQLEIMPEELPVYKHNIPYSVQLESNAEEPVYMADNLSVTGITFSPEGLISGTVPESENHATSEFTVTVTDRNQCVATKDYILQSCGAAPETPDLKVQYCKGTQAYPLYAEPSPDGLYMQWYDEELNGLGEEGPTPLTGVAGEQVFYVVYVNDALHCTSDTAEIKVTISPPPKPDFDAPDVNVCHGSSPVIHLSNLHETYIYDIYADAEMTEFLASVPEKPSGSVTLPDTPENTTAYYIRIIDSLECISEDPKEVTANVIQLEIMPDELPVYKHNIPYSVQLESNAEQPVFSIAAGNMVPEITLSPEGLISGTVPESENHATSEFTVTVMDINECTATKDYILQSCGPAPETPNPELQYCYRAQALQLQASSPEGLPLQWFDTRLNSLSGTPVPLTDAVGEQVFYVVQVNDALHCTSDTAEIKVTVTPLPKPDFRATVKDACYDGSPTILLDGIHESYTYSVYPDNTFHNTLGSLTGTLAGSIVPDNTITDSTAYFILVTDSLECTSTEWQEVTSGVIKLYIEPEKLQRYVKGAEYEQRLTTNAQSPIFSVIDGRLPDGLILNTSGLIYGAVPTSHYDLRNTFAIEVRDLNECRATREYNLYGDLFIPKVFTPNGDGINDFFMLTYKLVIYDRLGIELFRGDNGWDGTHNGKPVAEDIYFYSLEYADPEYGNIMIRTGYVGVVR